jgi:hypothetical protein
MHSSNIGMVPGNYCSMREGTHITRGLFCICETSTNLVLSDETCIMFGTVAVLEVDGWYRQVVKILAEVDLCNKHDIFMINTLNI